MPAASLVFDGSGEDLSYGPLEVRFAEDADTLLERLAAEHREQERVCLVSSDSAVRGTSGQEVMKLSSAHLLRDFGLEPHEEGRPTRARETGSTRRRGHDSSACAAGEIHKIVGPLQVLL